MTWATPQRYGPTDTGNLWGQWPDPWQRFGPSDARNTWGQWPDPWQRYGPLDEPPGLPEVDLRQSFRDGRPELVVAGPGRPRVAPLHVGAAPLLLRVQHRA